MTAGETTATFTVATLSDDLDEAVEESFTVTLSEHASEPLPEGVLVEGATATATGKITDYALIASVAGPNVVAEGSPATFTVTLDSGDDSRGNRTDVVVAYTTDNSTADAPADYTAPSGTLTILENLLTGTIVIDTQADDVLDHETLAVLLTGVTAEAGVAGVGTPDSVTTTIEDSGIVTVSVEDVTVEEGDPAVFTVELSGKVAEDVTVEYMTTAGTATDSRDYIGVSNGTVVVAAGQTAATITVATQEDSDGEGPETFTLTLTLPSAPTGVELGDETATATITDDDIALLPLGDVTVTEGQDKNITLMLERALPEAVTLLYSTAGSATEGEDYSLWLLLPDGTALPAQDAIPVPANTQTGVVQVRAVDDSLAEGR